MTRPWLDTWTATKQAEGLSQSTIENYTEVERMKLPADFSLKLAPLANRVSCFQISIQRDPVSFLPVAAYSIIPLLILYFLGMITFITVPRQENRLMIYSGTLFATSAYFLSVRQLLETPISLLEIAVLFGMLLWILAEAGSALTRRPHQRKRTA